MKKMIFTILLFLLSFTNVFSQDSIIFPKIRQGTTTRYTQLRVNNSSVIYRSGSSSTMYFDEPLTFSILKEEKKGFVSNWASVYIKLNSASSWGSPVVTRAETEDFKRNIYSWNWPNDNHTYGNNKIEIRIEFWTNGGIWADKRIGFQEYTFYKDTIAPVSSLTITQDIPNEGYTDEDDVTFYKELKIKGNSFSDSKNYGGPGSGIVWQSAKTILPGNSDTVFAYNFNHIISSEAPKFNKHGKYTFNLSSIDNVSNPRLYSKSFFLDIIAPVIVNPNLRVNLDTQIIVNPSVNEEGSGLQPLDISFLSKDTQTGEFLPVPTADPLLIYHLNSRNDSNRLIIYANDNVGNNSTESYLLSKEDISGRFDDFFDRYEFVKPVIKGKQYLDNYHIINEEISYQNLYLGKPENMQNVSDLNVVQSELTAPSYNHYYTFTFEDTADYFSHIDSFEILNNNFEEKRLIFQSTDFDSINSGLGVVSNNSGLYINRNLNSSGIYEYDFLVKHNSKDFNTTDVKTKTNQVLMKVYFKEGGYDEIVIGEIIKPNIPEIFTLNYGSGDSITLITDIFNETGGGTFDAFLDTLSINANLSSNLIELSVSEPIDSNLNDLTFTDIEGDTCTIASSRLAMQIKQYNLSAEPEPEIEIVGDILNSLITSGLYSGNLIINVAYSTNTDPDLYIPVKTNTFDILYEDLAPNIKLTQWIDPDSEMKFENSPVIDVAVSVQNERKYMEDGVEKIAYHGDSAGLRKFEIFELLKTVENSDAIAAINDTDAMNAFISANSLDASTIVFNNGTSDSNITLESDPVVPITSYAEKNISTDILVPVNFDYALKKYEALSSENIDEEWYIIIIGSDNSTNIGYDYALVTIDTIAPVIEQSFDLQGAINSNIVSNDQKTRMEITSFLNPLDFDDNDIIIWKVKVGDEIIKIPAEGIGKYTYEPLEQKLIIDPVDSDLPNEDQNIYFTLADKAGNIYTDGNGVSTFPANIFTDAELINGLLSDAKNVTPGSESPSYVDVEYEISNSSTGFSGYTIAIKSGTTELSRQTVYSDTFIHKDAESHSVYTYTITAINGSGIENESDFFTVTANRIPDIKSSEVEFAEPVSYLSENKLLKIKPVNGLYWDYDNISVLVFMTLTNNLGTEQLVEPVIVNQTNNNDPITIDLIQYSDFLTSSISCDIKVKVEPVLNDAQLLYPGEYWNSFTTDLGNFSVDNNAPQIKLADENPNNSTSEVLLFSRHDNVTYILTDSLSGIEKSGIEVLVNKSLYGESDYIFNQTAQGLYELIIPLNEGKQEVELSINDIAGNIRPEKHTFYIDRTAPEAQSIVIENAELQNSNYYAEPYALSGKIYFSNAPLIPETAVSGISKIKITFSKANETIVHSELINIPVESQECAFFIRSQLLHSLEEGEDYEIQVILTDKAGNESLSFTSNNSVIIDSSAPELELDLLNKSNLNNGIAYIKNNSELLFDVTSSDLQSGISETTFTLLNEAGTVLHTGNQEDGLAIIEPGLTYRFIVTTYNRVRVPAKKESTQFVYDNTKPVLNSFEILPERDHSSPYIQGETIRLTWDVSDSESDIRNVKIGIGTSVTGTFHPVITEQINGSESGYLSKNAGQGLSLAFTIPNNIPVVNNGEFELQLIIENNAGHVLNHKEPILISLVYEAIIPVNGAEYQNYTDQFLVGWDYKGPAADHFEYALIKIPESGALPAPQWRSVPVSAGNNYSQYINVSLDHGSSYFYKVRAALLDGTGGTTYISAESLPVTVDTTLPVLSPDDFGTPSFTHPEEFYFTWNAEEDVSGIRGIDVIFRKLINVDGESTLLDFDRLTYGVNTRNKTIGYDLSSYLENGLLVNGEHFYLVSRVYNNAGQMKEYVSLKVVVDNTAPEQPVVIDSGDYVHTKTYELDSNGVKIVDPQNGMLHFSWYSSIEENGEDPKIANDLESGIVNVSYQLFAVVDGLNESNWISVDSNRVSGDSSFTISEGSALEGKHLLIAVKVTNGANLTSIGFSDGVVIDNTKPIIFNTRIADANELNQNNRNLQYINRKNSLDVDVQAYDKQSPIIRKTAQFGVFKDGNFEPIGSELPQELIDSEVLDPFLFLTFNLNRPEIRLNSGNIIFIESTVENAAGLIVKGYSSGVVFDNTVPEVKDVTGFVANGYIYLNWNSYSEFSPIKTTYLDLSGIAAAEDGGGPLSYNYWNGSAGVSSSDNNFLPFIEDQIKCKNSDGSQKILQGTFTLQVYVEDYAGNFSLSKPSNQFIYDTSAPVLKSFDANLFTSNAIYFNAVVEDTLSTVEEYEYTIGTLADPFLVSGGWNNSFNQSSSISEVLLLENAPFGIDSIVHNTRLFVKLRVKNSSSLWTKDLFSNSILVDKTAPEHTRVLFDMTRQFDTETYTLDNFYINKKDFENRVAFSTDDPESGINGWKYIVLPSTADIRNVPLEHWTEGIAPAVFTTDFLSAEFDISSYDINEEHDYKLYVKAQNGALDYSEVFTSDIMIFDNTAPQVQLILPPEPIAAPYNFFIDTKNAVNYYVINENSALDFEELLYSVNDTKSEINFVTLQIITDTGIVHSAPADLLEALGFKEGHQALPQGASTLLPIWIESVTENYGNYFLLFTVTDSAGNMISYYPSNITNDILNRTSVGGFPFRINRPPVAENLNSLFVTNPGKGFTFSDVTEINDTFAPVFVDNDQDAFTIEWRVIDLGEDITNPQLYINDPADDLLFNNWTGIGTAVKYYHRGGLPAPGEKYGPAINLPESRYALELRVTDEFNKESEFIRILQVLNTSEGFVHNPEIWSTMGLGSASHIITGDITIPEDITVQVISNAKVEILFNSVLSSYYHGIFVNGIFILNNGVSITVPDNNAANAELMRWQGIEVTGTISAQNISIKDADRAITIAPDANATLRDIVFLNNIIGIHVLQPGIEIINCEFTDSEAFGIKEDNNSDPILIGNVFTDNQFDYYDTVLTVLDVLALDNLQLENNGNRGK